MSKKLPGKFKDLEPLMEDWALETQSARYERRRTSSMEELGEFYNRLQPYMDEMVVWLNNTPLEKFDSTQCRLMNLALMFIEVSMAVELFQEPDEAKAMPAHRYKIIEGPLGSPSNV